MSQGFITEQNITLPLAISQGGTGQTSMTAKEILYASSSNTIGQIATASGAVLSTNGSSVPSFSTELPAEIILNTPVITGNLLDINGNNLLGISPNASAVNYITIANAVTTSSPTLAANGTDTNINLTLQGQGTGGVAIKGTGTNDSASAGYVGEIISSVIPYASSVTLMTNSAADITTVLLSAGDWDVWGNFTITDSVNTLVKSVGWINTSSASVPDRSLYSGYYSTTTVLSIYGGSVPMVRYSLSGSTTIYLSTEAQFASGTTTVCGGIYARRVR